MQMKFLVVQAGKDTSLEFWTRTEIHDLYSK